MSKRIIWSIANLITFGLLYIIGKCVCVRVRVWGKKGGGGGGGVAPNEITRRTRTWTVLVILKLYIARPACQLTTTLTLV